MTEENSAKQLHDELRKEIDQNPVLGNGGDADSVRRDCAFCHRERARKDDNHAPNCPYWDFFPGVAG